MVFNIFHQSMAGSIFIVSSKFVYIYSEIHWGGGAKRAFALPPWIK